MLCLTYLYLIWGLESIDMTQKKITEKMKEEEFLTPIETLLSFLDLPHKLYRPIYIAVIEHRLSIPLLQNDANMARLAREVGIEPALMLEKIRSMVRMKWIEHEEVGKRQTNQIFVISPIWRYKSGIDKAKFAIALQEYKAAIIQDKQYQMNTEEIYDLMYSVCPHTKTNIEYALCKLSRWEECKTCSHKLEEGTKNERQ
jgi:hypothetical protein